MIYLIVFLLLLSAAITAIDAAKHYVYTNQQHPHLYMGPAKSRVSDQKVYMHLPGESLVEVRGLYIVVLAIMLWRHK